MTTRADRSYRALFAVPAMPRILLGMAISRIANGMVSVALVLFALQEYHSPEIAGLVTFASIAPGLLVSPVAGALLDRHGRSRLIVLDLFVAAASIGLIAWLAFDDALPAPLLVAIVAVASLTQPLSSTGLRSLFPLLLPKTLWARANAVDSNGYVIATLVGPPIAGLAVQVFGGPATLAGIAVVFAVSGLVLIGIPDPRIDVATTGNLLRDAWQGLLYTLRNPTLRALAVGLSIANLAAGVQTLVVPILVIRGLGGGEAMVGLVWAVSGISGGIAALLAGRVDWRGRERVTLPLATLGIGVSWIGLLVLPPSLALLVGVLAVGGIFNGVFDVAMFGLRQRRTDPTWLGRAFAISMSLNFLGYPVGAAIGGALVGVSLDAAIAFGVVASVIAAVLTWVLLPGEQARRRVSPAEVGLEP